MRKTNLGRLLAVLILFTPLSSGCATLQSVFQPAPPSPKTRVAQLETDYTATLRVLVDARILGLISDDEYKAIEVHRKNAAAALELLKAAAEGGAVDSTALEQFRTALDALIAARTKVSNE